MQQMPYVRSVLSESLRLYPQPPILIRRALGEDTLPMPLTGDPDGYPIGKGADLFISVYNLHRWAWQAPVPTLLNVSGAESLQHRCIVSAVRCVSPRGKPGSASCDVRGSGRSSKGRDAGDPLAAAP